MRVIAILCVSRCISTSLPSLPAPNRPSLVEADEQSELLETSSVSVSTEFDLFSELSDEYESAMALELDKAVLDKWVVKVRRDSEEDSEGSIELGSGHVLPTLETIEGAERRNLGQWFSSLEAAIEEQKAEESLPIPDSGILAESPARTDTVVDEQLQVAATDQKGPTHMNSLGGAEEFKSVDKDEVVASEDSRAAEAGPTLSDIYATQSFTSEGERPAVVVPDSVSELEMAVASTGIPDILLATSASDESVFIGVVPEPPPGCAGNCLRCFLAYMPCLGRKVKTFSAITPQGCLAVCALGCADRAQERFLFSDFRRGLIDVLVNMAVTHRQVKGLVLAQNGVSVQSPSSRQDGVRTFITNVRDMVLLPLDEVIVRFDLRMLEYSGDARDTIEDMTQVNRIRKLQRRLHEFLLKNDRRFSDWQSVYERGIRELKITINRVLIVLNSSICSCSEGAQIAVKMATLFESEQESSL